MGPKFPPKYDISVSHEQISATPSTSSPASTDDDDDTAAVMTYDDASVN